MDRGVATLSLNRCSHCEILTILAARSLRCPLPVGVALQGDPFNFKVPLWRFVPSTPTNTTPLASSF